jgi:hypothetical protein
MVVTSYVIRLPVSYIANTMDATPEEAHGVRDVNASRSVMYSVCGCEAARRGNAMVR